MILLSLKLECKEGMKINGKTNRKRCAISSTKI